MLAQHAPEQKAPDLRDLTQTWSSFVAVVFLKFCANSFLTFQHHTYRFHPLVILTDSAYSCFLCICVNAPMSAVILRGTPRRMKG